MAKKVIKKIKLQIQAGAINPATIGPVLGGAGVNIGEFTKQFNEKTKEMKGDTVRVLLSVYEDRTFDFLLKSPPASRMILKAIGIEKGSGKNTASKAGKISKAKLKEVAEAKMTDLNTKDVNQAMKIIAGTARSMGVDVQE